jgi:hypothetical protein
MNTITENVVERLKRIAQGDLTDIDIALISSDIADKLKAGWTEKEIIGCLKYMEEINPELDESYALAKMTAHYQKVEKRLKSL